MLILEAIYIIVCLGLAKYNAVRISQGLRIYHALNGMIHFIYWGIAYLYIKDWSVIVFPFIGRVCFDFALNLMRGLDAGYVPEKPKSIFDILEKAVFKKDGLTPKLIYGLIIIIINSILWLH